MFPKLDEAAQRALSAKVARHENEWDETRFVEEPQFQTRGLLSGDFEEFRSGYFENLENIRLRWIQPDYFEFLPVREAPFAYVRHTGERIVPGRMFTDGGSIPRFLWAKKSLSPWGYGPAFLVHDWEFDAHHCKMNNKSFEEVRDTMMEAIRTLVDLGFSERADFSFRAVYQGIDSSVARDMWNRNPEVCPLPPQVF